MAYLESLEKDVQEIKLMLTVLLEQTAQSGNSNEYDKYPPVLTAKHVQEILGVSHVQTYEFMRRSDFPKIMAGTKYLVPKQAFIDWMNSSANTR